MAESPDLMIQAQAILAADKAMRLWAAGDLDQAQAIGDLLAADDYLLSVAALWWSNRVALAAEIRDLAVVTTRTADYDRVLALGRLVRDAVDDDARDVCADQEITDLWASFGDQKGSVAGLALDLAGQLTAIGAE